MKYLFQKANTDIGLLFKYLHSLGDVLLKPFVVTKEVSPATTDGIIQFLAHVIGIVRNGQLYIILLPVERGMNIDALFLMQETIGGLDTILCYHLVT